MRYDHRYLSLTMFAGAGSDDEETAFEEAMKVHDHREEDKPCLVVKIVAEVWPNGTIERPEGEGSESPFDEQIVRYLAAEARRLGAARIASRAASATERLQHKRDALWEALTAEQRKTLRMLIHGTEWGILDD